MAGKREGKKQKKSRFGARNCGRLLRRWKLRDVQFIIRGWPPKQFEVKERNLFVSWGCRAGPENDRCHKLRRALPRRQARGPRTVSTRARGRSFHFFNPVRPNENWVEVVHCQADLGVRTREAESLAFVRQVGKTAG